VDLALPIGPARIRFSGAVTHRPRASARAYVTLTPSAVKSNVSSVLISGEAGLAQSLAAHRFVAEACSALRTSCE
jgi:hypothetical protein